MKVYRFLSEEELNLHQSGQSAEAGRCYPKNSNFRLNSFRYKPNTRYVHFFKNLKDIKFVKQDFCEVLDENAKKLKFYIACFDIPSKVLAAGAARGRYIEASGNGMFEETYATEYVVESAMMKREYLKYFKEEQLDKELHWRVDEFNKEKK